MGQRTQIICKRNWYKDNKLEYSDIAIYHLQWGFAKVMPAWLMSETVKACYKYVDSKPYEFSELNCEFNTTHSRKEEDSFMVETYDNILKQYGDNVFDIATAKALFDACDNNNGGMIVEADIIIKSTCGGLPMYDIKSVKVGFMRGYEDCKSCKDAFAEFISPATYMLQWKDYCPICFINSFEGFCETFGVKIFTTKI